MKGQVYLISFSSSALQSGVRTPAEGQDKWLLTKRHQDQSLRQPLALAPSALLAEHKEESALEEGRSGPSSGERPHLHILAEEEWAHVGRG